MSQIKNNVNDCPAKITILYVGIGNPLRSDDAVGVYICGKIKTNEIIRKLSVEAGIENYIGKINEMSPDLVILIDCVDFGRDPGYYTLIRADQLYGRIYNTHNISLKNLSTLFNMPVWILGIQPESVKVGEGMSEVVVETADWVADLINLWTELNYTPVNETPAIEIP